MTTSIDPAESLDETRPGTPAPGPPAVWTETARGREFTELRRRLRRFVFPVAALFLAWYLSYAVLLVYARGFMGTQVIGNVTVAILLALLQFGSTFAITLGYVGYANRRLDPLADAIRARIEEGAR